MKRFNDINALLRKGEAYLIRHSVPNARKNAEWLLAHTLGCGAIDLYLDGDTYPVPLQIQGYRRLLKRRGDREPLQYIVRSTEFMSESFLAMPGVFIPRPETERLVEIVESGIAECKKNGDFKILDLCCGSGAILISLLRRIPGTTGVAVDVDDAAAMLAGKNAELAGMGDRMECVRSDARAFIMSNPGRFHAVVCNPPYICSEEIGSLAPEVRKHEPHLGLDGGEDGLDFYRDTIPFLDWTIETGGMVAFEIGAGQGKVVSDLLRSAAFESVKVHHDYSAFERVVTARHASSVRHRGGGVTGG